MKNKIEEFKATRTKRPKVYKNKSSNLVDKSKIPKDLGDSTST